MMYNEEDFLTAKKEEVIDSVPMYLWSDWLEQASEEDRNDLDFMRQLVTARGECLRLAPAALRSERKTVLEAIRDFSYAITYAAEELQNDREFVRQAIKARTEVILYVRDQFKKDKELALLAVRRAGCYIEDIDPSLQTDPDMIAAALEQNPVNLRYTAPETRDDKTCVLPVVRAKGHILEYVSQRLRADKEVALAAVSSSWTALSFVLGGLNDDREVVLAAVTANGASLQFASEARKNDREIVLAAVRSDGNALRYASEALRDDKEIALAAVTNGEYAVACVSRRLLHDREVIAAAMGVQPARTFASLPEELRQDLDYVFFALETIAEHMPDSDDYGFFADGTSEYYSDFEEAEDSFCEIAGTIPVSRLQADPALAEKLCAIAIRADGAYYDEGDNPYEGTHERLPYRLRDYFAEHEIPVPAILAQAVAALEPEGIPIGEYEDRDPTERLLFQTADRLDWEAGKRIGEDGLDAYRGYLSPGGGYVRRGMVSFVKGVIASWPGLFHSDPLWEDRKYEVDLDKVYEELRARLRLDIPVKRAAFEYYYSEYVGVTVSQDVFFRLVRGMPLRILDLWVNEMDSEHSHPFRVSPDRLDEFCAMTRFLFDNYGRFSGMLADRAAKMLQKYEA